MIQAYPDAGSWLYEGSEHLPKGYSDPEIEHGHHRMSVPHAAEIEENRNKIFTVIAVKRINGKDYIVVDGQVSDAGFACKYKSPPYRHFGSQSNVVKNAAVVGCTCIEDDYIIKDYTGPANVGDKIVTTGANNVTEGQKVLFPEEVKSEK